MRGKTGSEDTPQKAYSYFYCRNCKKYFTITSHIASVCPFCSTPGHIFPLGVLTKDTPVRDRLFIAMPKCVKCTDAYRCPECIGGEKRTPADCRACTCAVCCNEMLEFAKGIRSGRLNLWQVVRELAEKRGAKPGPMAKMMEQEVFEDEIPF
jgi:hypothetical protein